MNNNVSEHPFFNSSINDLVNNGNFIIIDDNSEDILSSK